MDREYIVNRDGERLDIYIRDILKDISRSYIQDLIKDKLVSVNGEYKKPNYIVSIDDRIIISKRDKKEIKSENLNLEIIYEDDYIAIINKPLDMIVHPTSNIITGTLVNGLLYRFNSLSDAGEDYRPGIVHRLDKDTSGIMVIAKDNNSYYKLVDQFKNRSVYREYIGIVHGVIAEDEFTINRPIGRDIYDRRKMDINYENSKEAITHIKVLNRYEDYSLIQANLETGRMHQIRVHLSHIGHPILGDEKYSNRMEDRRFNSHFLHARKIGFIHPYTDKYVEYMTKTPIRFDNFINNIIRG